MRRRSSGQRRSHSGLSVFRTPLNRHRPQKTFDAEGEALEHALTKSLHLRNEAIKSLCSSVRRFRDATVKPECKSDYMTTAAKALVSEGFRQLELNRIQARFATENYPSQAVCDRLGLKKEGILRQAEWANNHFIDLTMNSVLRSEWNQKVAKFDTR